MTSSGSDLLDPTCNVIRHAFPSRLSLTSLLSTASSSSSFSVVRTFTLKARLPALRGFSVRVESQGLESGTELVREDCFYTNLFTSFRNGGDILERFILENVFLCLPLQNCIKLLSSVSLYCILKSHIDFYIFGAVHLIVL